ncbi:MAG TPA: hypothetical protein PKH33_16510 [bacterium]|nr:hypothetical protein [bacterium]
MKKKKQSGKKKENIEGSNPLIVINEPDESLFAIVDFSVPGSNHVRRIISKKNLKNGKITAVIYQGEVGADNLCVNKRDIRELRDATPEIFWKSVNTMSELYRIM